MPNYNQINYKDTKVRFSNAMFGDVERSRVQASPIHITTFNAGDIVPIYCREVLPTESVKMDLDFVIRQTTLLVPTMGSMKVDFYAFFVPNRIVNHSFKAVMGENYSGSWTANQVSLAPLKYTSTGSTKVPVGSVADYYGFPTQKPLPNSLLARCNDLKFRGYVAIYNEWFRDQNYQPPIAISYLNTYQGFMDNPEVDTSVYLNGSDASIEINGSTVPDGSYGAGALAHAIYGSGRVNEVGAGGNSSKIIASSLMGRFDALGKPLKANKLHDYFTSVLPSPLKSAENIFVPVSGQLSTIPVTTSGANVVSGSHPPLSFNSANGSSLSASHYSLDMNGRQAVTGSTVSTAPGSGIYPSNLVTEDGATVDGLEISLSDIRMASAVEQIFEVLGQGGSRYRELVQSFFGLEVEDPYSDIPQYLGHISRDLDLYQTVQTSPSVAGSTAQGNLAAFGYTNSSGRLFEKTFIEHGYVHVFAVVRHRNVYSSLLWPDNFRMNMLDFYFPSLANISNQPVSTAFINPFASNPEQVFGYQEAWAEYRYEPDMVSGEMRPKPDDPAGQLAVWNYADPFDDGIVISNADWIKSNSEDVLNRTLSTTSEIAPQLKGQFRFIVDRDLPMPTFSVPGLDII